MHRPQFPERIPFRLTRMLIKAMEVSGIEGSFRNTSENVMRVLRGNRESVMAVLEAFVHDPLINWRILYTSPRQRKLHTTCVMSWLILKRQKDMTAITPLTFEC